MDKNSHFDFQRLFLTEGLPEPLTPASSHLQLFDNYIENTRLRLRQIRDPYTKEWTRILQQKLTPPPGQEAATRTAEIHLDDAEYAVFERFEGREIRKNRYFHEFDRVEFTFDVYLGGLWGLTTARAFFHDKEAMEKFVRPPFAVIEVTNDPFFTGMNMVGKKFADVQTEVARIANAALGKV